MDFGLERPFVQRLPVLNGWVIVVAGTAGLIMTQPGRSLVLSVITDAFTEDRNISRVLSALPLAVLYSLVLGVSNGIPGTVSSVVWADHYDRQHLGTIAGLGATVTRVSSAFGPVPLALAFATYGGYGIALRIEVVIPLVLAVLNLIVRPPHDSATSA